MDNSLQTLDQVRASAIDMAVSSRHQSVQHNPGAPRPVKGCDPKPQNRRRVSSQLWLDTAAQHCGGSVLWNRCQRRVEPCQRNFALKSPRAEGSDASIRGCTTRRIRRHDQCLSMGQCARLRSRDQRGQQDDTGDVPRTEHRHTPAAM